MLVLSGLPDIAIIRIDARKYIDCHPAPKYFFD